MENSLEPTEGDSPSGFSDRKQNFCFGLNPHYHTSTTVFGSCCEEIFQERISLKSKVCVYGCEIRNSVQFRLNAGKLILLWHHISVHPLGMTSSPLRWFHSYLSSRPQFIQLKSSKSQPSLIFSGVPQGSVLGSLLFITYLQPLAIYSVISTLILIVSLMTLSSTCPISL